MSREQALSESAEQEIHWCLDESEGSQDVRMVSLSEDKKTLTYKGGRDYWMVRSNKSFTSGIHYVVVHVHRIGDEGDFGLINDLSIVGNTPSTRHRPGVHYYPGRRHKTGDLSDGCASLKIDGKPLKRMFHIADGVDVGLLINCETRMVDFYLNNMWQGAAAMPTGTVWVTSVPDKTEDCFEIMERPLPYRPSTLASWCIWLRKACCGSEVHEGDVVKLNGRYANVYYGPDLQGDLQLIFNDIYPELFAISGDMNLSNAHLQTHRSLTSLTIAGTVLSSMLTAVFLYLSAKVAYHAKDRLTLEDHVPFKCCIVGFLFSLTVALLLVLMKVPNVEWKTRMLRTLQIVPTTLGVIFIALWGAEEVDLKCSEEHWRPMIPAITQLYAPSGVDRDDVSGWLQLALFNPVLAQPAVVLPSMEKSIASRDLKERCWYFLTQLLLMVGITCLVLEVLRLMSTRCIPKIIKMLSCGATQSLATDLETDAEAAPLVKPSPTPEAAKSKVRRMLYMGAFILWYLCFQVLLHIEMDVMVMIGAVNLRTGPAWEFWILFISYICITHFVTGIVRYVVEFGVEQKPATSMVLTTLAPVVGNEIHIFKDHVETALCFAVAHCNEGELKLVAMVLGYLSFAATFAPLAFLFSDKASRQGLVRAHWPLLEATEPEASVPFTAAAQMPHASPGEDDSDEEQLEKLEEQLEKAVNATVFNASAVACKLREVFGSLWHSVTTWLEPYARRFVDMVIPAVTIEKEIRAFVGECPSGFLDMVFIFFFGGSFFMIFAVAISVAKVLGIPIVREHILPPLIKRYGCSMAALKLYRLNSSHVYLFDARSDIMAAIERFQWTGFKDGLIAGGYGESRSVQEAMLAAAKAGKGKALRDEFEALSQSTDYILVSAIQVGKVEDVEALAKSGFNTKGLYSHSRVFGGRQVTLDVIVKEFFGKTDRNGNRILGDKGKDMLAALAAGSIP
eukprot:TRINITY_DN120754_c0_g1_i1.p1 TRINITY_DN120754_c0_g1~~TRINITY_DN120754_c0_g1_i1.p1  ORF type:complete len:984 (-),score=117.43 TRINITY_DN120754_c0_g1_i1:447-3326(-)